MRLRKDPLLGKRVNNYRIVSVLGRGGFGSVYEAEDKKLGRKAALKFLTDSSDDLHSHLFEREAKAIAALSKHPNIVQIYGWDEFKGQNYFALEYVGSSVEDLLKRSPRGLPPKLALRIAGECAEALAHAHNADILHRDIKPANILIEDGTKTAKLADFGLARIRGVSQNTIEGSVIGSPAYMSPEQVRGAQISKKTDIYSLGITLYQMLCGRTPVAGDSHLEILEKIRNDEGVPLRQRRSKMREEIVRLVEKATAHDPKDRFKSAEAFAAAIQDTLELEGGGSERRSGGRRRYAVAAALLLVGALAFAAYRTPAVDAPETNEQMSAATEATDASPFVEKTKAGLEDAGAFVVEKGKNAKDRIQTFIQNRRNSEADSATEDEMPEPEDTESEPVE